MEDYLTDAERQRRRYARRKAGLVLVQEWVPTEAVEAVRAAIAEAVKAFPPTTPTISPPRPPR